MDLDHFFPVIQALLERDHRVVLLALESVRPHAHPAFRILSGKFTCEILREPGGGRLPGLLSRLAGRNGVSFNQFKARLIKNSIDVVCIDWQKISFLPGTRLAQAARELTIPVVALPHGVDTIQDPEYLKMVPNYGNADFVVTPSFIRHDALRNLNAGIRPKVEVLGSARYDPRWVRQMDTLTSSESGSLSRSRGFRILYIDSSDPEDDSGELVVLLEALAEIAGVSVHFKAKPRAPFRLDSLLSEGTRVRVEDDTDTSVLMRAADLVLATSTSAALEAIVLSKPLIWCKFADRWKSNAYAEYSGCWIAESADDVIRFSNGLMREELDAYPNALGRQNFIKDVLCGGREGSSIDHYVGFLEKVSIQAKTETVRPV